MNIEPIGFLKTCFGSKFAVPRQPGLCPAAWGILEFSGKYRSPEAVRGLEGFSHVWLVFGFHETQGRGWHSTVRPPRLGGNERVGVFASRATHRPNGLGLSLVKLDSVALDGCDDMVPPLLHVSGVDLVSGTPIYDVKPYLPYAESIPDADCGYAKDPIARLSVEIDEAISEQFSLIDEKDQTVMREVLSLDPRPAASAEDATRIYGAHLCGWNVKFRVYATSCWISEIEEIS